MTVIGFARHNHIGHPGWVPLCDQALSRRPHQHRWGLPHQLCRHPLPPERRHGHTHQSSTIDALQNLTYQKQHASGDKLLPVCMQRSVNTKALLQVSDDAGRKMLRSIQNELFDLGADHATPGEDLRRAK